MNTEELKELQRIARKIEYQLDEPERRRQAKEDFITSVFKWAFWWFVLICLYCFLYSIAVLILPNP